MPERTPMSKRAEKAWRASVQKWQANADADSPADWTLGTPECPLCQLYFRQKCYSCPIRQKTGKWRCVDTPYEAAVEAKYKWEENPTEESAALAKRAAQAELDFLKSLGPET